MDFDAAQWEMAQQQMQNCDPEQMKAQARMMKNMDKDNLRRMNPQFANMSDSEIDMAASQMEMMASNPAMLKMAAAQMGGMSHGQAQAQMKAVQGARGKKKGGAALAAGYKVGDRVELKGLKGAAEHNGKHGTVTGGQNERLKVLLDGSDSKTLALKPANLDKLAGDDGAADVPAGGLDLDALPNIDADQLKQASEAMKNADPEQMKAQAAAMRNMDPATIRSMNPQMAHMSDAQIKAAADQMDAIAGNPEMMKMAMEQMENMPPEVLEQQMKMMQNMSHEEKQQMQEAMGGMMGGGGMPPGGGMPDAETASKMMANISEEQMGSMIDMVKKNPDMIKSMMKSNPMTAGMDEAAIDKQLEMLDKLDPETVKKFVGYAQKAQKVFGPLIALYAKVNRAVGGKLAQILGASLVAVVAFYVSKWTGLLAYGAPAADAPPADLAGLKDAAVEAVESVTAAVNGGEDDEFA